MKKDFKTYKSISLLNYRDDKDYMDFNFYTTSWSGLFVEHFRKPDPKHISDYNNFKIMFESMRKRETTILLK